MEKKKFSARSGSGEALPLAGRVDVQKMFFRCVDERWSLIMPIYEFYCPDCHVIYNFLSTSVDTDKRPHCPRCARPRLERQVSVFAISKGLAEQGGDDLSGLDESKMEQAMSMLAREAGSLDEEDPRQAARLMRRLSEAAGFELGPGMQEAMRRMEAGEDPEQIEAELGDVLERKKVKR
jgi:putative FmdB family regulatory protein